MPNPFPLDKSHLYIIAEFGSLHLKTMRGALGCAKAAFDNGADMVKYQCINPLSASWANKEQKIRYERNWHGHAWWRDLIGEANTRFDKPVFASVFDKLEVDILQDVMPVWKVALRMHENEDMIRAMEVTGKPIIFSTNHVNYKADAAKFFDKNPLQHHTLYATPYDPYKVLTQYSLKDELVKNRHIGLSLNFGGKDGLELCRYLSPYVNVLELHTYWWGPNGPDAKWAYWTKRLPAMRRLFLRSR